MTMNQLVVGLRDHKIVI